jgi:hypothetical protein
MTDALITVADSPAARRCAHAVEFWQLLFSSLNLTAYREKGEEGLRRLWQGMLGPQHQAQFLRGLAKLGIDPEGPPAVVAGKYHYLTNLIGGLRMQYIEESPVKVWNRNMGPMWAFPGLAMLAIPTALRREMMAVWHPNDGPLLGSARLGWVITKSITEGHPYDEGYFFEYPHEIGPGERVRYEVARRTPECDEAAQPKLDLALWPQARVLKARERYVGGYVRAAMGSLLDRYGERTAYDMLEQALVGLAIQFTPQLLRSHGVDGNDTETFAAFASSLLGAWQQDHEVQVVDRLHFRILVTGDLVPYAAPAAEGLRAAYFRFFEAAARMVSGRLAVSRQAGSHEAPLEVWDIRNTGNWLW